MLTCRRFHVKFQDQAALSNCLGKMSFGTCARAVAGLDQDASVMPTVVTIHQPEIQVNRLRLPLHSSQIPGWPGREVAPGLSMQRARMTLSLSRPRCARAFAVRSCRKASVLKTEQFSPCQAIRIIHFVARMMPRQNLATLIEQHLPMTVILFGSIPIYCHSESQHSSFSAQNETISNSIGGTKQSATIPQARRPSSVAETFLKIQPLQKTDEM